MTSRTAIAFMLVALGAIVPTSVLLLVFGPEHNVNPGSARDLAVLIGCGLFGLVLGFGLALVQARSQTATLERLIEVASRDYRNDKHPRPQAA